MAGNTVKEMTTNFGKLDKFEGHDFRRWQKKMHFLLTTLKVVYVLTTPMPELMEDSTVEAIRIRAKWENDDYICRGHILNGMSDSLFDVYTNVESAKELWDSLESKYMAEDSSSKKFLVSNFNNYKMVDSRPVMEQYNELLRILGQYTQHGLKMDESISVSSIIDKLPPSWKDFKHTLKHGKDDLSLVQLGSHLRIEESLRAQDSDKGKGKEVVKKKINAAFTTVDKTAHNYRKFAFTLSPTNYGYWKTMIEPFLITNNLMGYVDGSIPCLSKTLSVTDDATVPKENPNYPIWVSNDTHVHMLIISTISEASFRHVQGTPSRDLWLSLEKADHDYMLGKTRAPAPSITSSFAANYAHSDTGANSHVTPDLEAMGNSEAYYGDDALHVGNGIIHRRSCPHTSEQNGFVERRNRHVVEIGLTLLAQACVPQRFWHYAFDIAVYLINRMPSRTSTNKSPFEHIFKRSPDYSFLPVFGCLCFPHLCPYNRHKMDFHSTSCVFLGYSPSHHGYRCLDISTERLYIARHVCFNEAQFPFDIPKTTSLPPSKTSPYYSSESPYIIPTTDHPSPSSPRSLSLVSHLSPTSQTSLESSNGQPSPSTTIRAVLSFAVTNDWPLRQLDIQNAFLHGNLKERAPRAWFERLSKALFDLGFKGSKTDPSLFIYSRRDTLLYILVYVDDIIVTGNNKGTIDNIICQLGFAFALKDLGPLNYLGIEIVPYVFGILLSQKKYILELLQSAGLSNYNPVSSPMVTSSSLSVDDSTAFSNPVKYQQVVGSLQYVTLSRPDIAFAVNKVCQYMHALTENHWSAVKWILCYLHGNPDTSLEAFLDSNWAGDSDDRRSTEGFSIYLGLNLISWTAHKQRTISRSSTEVEYKALADTVVELTWL
ncbi:retrovirus-related pol polyprotein from transposon TNT 1-94 [Tanacetum coccineum]|uniref:Retrovirus-related pol polyprotein from transposon TNT 1-94 n=1 Tax=Tanacetum coccineum TaxID=301880 RepID=A0ABQ4XFE1_9ASTR